MSASRTNTASSSIRAMLCYTVIIALFASLFLSADAIRCHQCNSHLDEDCIALRLVTPRAPRDDQYLKECESDDENGFAVFCRKTVVTIEVTGEHRIVRGCGFNKVDLRGRNNTCYTADNEGYLQTICACTEDGCNAAPARFGGASGPVVLSLVACSLLVATLLRPRA